ncbi:MAG: endo-1,4-beta-xylanase [Patescibacteria group bacterium]
MLNFFESARNPDMKLGVSFDPEYAGSLSMDPAEVFRLLADDWQFRYFRLSLPWDKVESVRGTFDFTEMDYFLSEAQKRGARVMLAIGNKTPRWPECHHPGWVASLPPAEFRAALLNYLSVAVEHYKDNPAIEMWQVENEPFLAFGNCTRLTNDELRGEVALVKKIDPVHPVLVADSGELTLWNVTARAGDLFGMTMYRVVWSKYFGYWSYDWLPPSFYRLKLWLAGRPLQSSYVVELQAEPWAQNGSLDKMSIEEQNKSMDLVRLRKNLDYAKRVGAPRVYLWGGEWWAWLLKNGHNEIPDFVAGLNSQN